MAKVVKIYETGGPDVLRFEDARVGEPGLERAGIVGDIPY